MLIRSRLVTRCSPLCVRTLSTSAPRRNATPDWQELIGGRARIQQKQAQFEDKYRAALERKAREEGVSLEELKQRGEVRAKTQEVLGRKPVKPKEAKENEKSLPPKASPEAEAKAAENRAAARSVSKSSGDSPIKPLHEILDLSKAASLPPAQIAALWTAYHQQKGFLSAAIPAPTYERMSEVAKKYPLFVLPLARDPVEGAADAGEAGAVEMHLLQWAFLPTPSSSLEPVPSPSTVLFTPLIQYQTHQSFAQPYLILTHYTDLAASHGLVLMRGELTENVALSGTDAQVLAVRMQLFYNWVEGGERSVGSRDAERRELLRTFHEDPERFDLEKLVKCAWEID